MRRFLIFLAALAPVAGCDTLEPGRFEPEVVVNAVLVAGDPLPAVHFATTVPIDAPDGSAAPIEAGEVAVLLLAGDGSVEATYAYEPRERGFFAPVGEAPPVQGGRTYRLRADVPGFEGTVRAETTVPTAFEVVTPPADTLRYQVDPQPSMDVTPSTFPGRQSVYVFTVEALAPDADQLTPFAAAIFESADVDLEDFVTGNSPLLNEENYEHNPDGSLTVRVPWLSINFYGSHRFLVTALDDALVAFLESQFIQFIPTTLSPGEIPSVVSNVENGVGLFGSAAQVEATTFIARP